MKTIHAYQNVAYRRKSNLNQIVLYFWVLIVVISGFSDFGDVKTKHLMITRYQIFVDLYSIGIKQIS